MSNERKDHTMSKTIEVMDGDTFTISAGGAAYLYRKGESHGMSLDRVISTPKGPGETAITLSQFRTIAEIAGYTVVTAPAKEEVVKITHAITAIDRPGVFEIVGTKEAVAQFAFDNAIDDRRVVRIRIGGA